MRRRLSWSPREIQVQRTQGPRYVHHPRFTSRSFTRDWLTAEDGHTRFLPLKLCHSYAMVHCTLSSMYVTSSWLTSTMPDSLPPFGAPHSFPTPISIFLSFPFEHFLRPGARLPAAADTCTAFSYNQ